MELDEHQGQEDGDEEEDEEDMGVPVPPLVFESLSYSKMGQSAEEGGGVPSTIAARKGSSSIRYRECLKNHAVSIGGYAVDGCREFMAAGEEGKLEALKCAACNCHRNFHRKETDVESTTTPVSQYQHRHQQHYHPQQLSPYYRTPPSASGGYLPQPHPHQRPHPLSSHQVPHHRSLALPASAASGGEHTREEEDISNPSSSGGGRTGSGTKTKRFRTKFTQEQKEKMLAFAERLGWRMQKHDYATVEQFCAEIGVKRQVLKVWMHNNKNSLGKQP